MMVFAIRIELANVVAVQCLHDTDPREHCRAAARHEHQRFDRRRPLLGLVLGLRELGDVGCRILERDERSPVRQLDWSSNSQPQLVRFDIFLAPRKSNRNRRNRATIAALS
jgi:hypothetical protein